MKLEEFLLLVKKLAEKYDISEPFLVGGVPRDKVTNNLKNLEDLDITTGDNSIIKLAEILESKTKQVSSFKKMEGGHTVIKIGKLKLDFSTNFIVPDIDKIVGRQLSNLEQEMFSRDFTCNTLLLTLDLKEILDVTNMALEDINNKIIKCCLDPEITLGLDNKRIIRVFYMAAKLNFNIDATIFNWIKKNPSLIANVDPSYLSKKLKKTLSYNENLTLQLIKEMGVSQYLPLTNEQFAKMEIL